jgi:hypothetical protein
MLAMTAKLLIETMKRVETWPDDAQRELAAIALEIDAALKGGVYTATPEELAGIDRGVRAAEGGHFASADDVAAVLAKYRPA